jgi:hypothetical protein
MRRIQLGMPAFMTDPDTVLILLYLHRFPICNCEVESTTITIVDFPRLPRSNGKSNHDSDYGRSQPYIVSSVHTPL